MLLTVDIGNTQTAIGLFADDILCENWALTTRSGDTVDEIHLALAGQLSLSGRDMDRIDAVAISSVVPTLTMNWAQVARRITSTDPVIVGPGTKTGLPMRYDNPAEVGADRVADAVAAIALEGAPVVVVDLGTATNIEVVDKEGCFRGGIIAPGLATGAAALFSHAARIPQTDLAKPEHVIGSNTGEAVHSGLILGEVERVDGLVRRIFEELGYTAPVIATGGLAGYIYGLSSAINRHEPHLTLEGLRQIYERNR